MFGRDNLLENGQGRYRGERRSSSWSFRVRVRRLLEGSPGGRHPSVDYQPPLICYTTLEGTTSGSLEVAEQLHEEAKAAHAAALAHLEDLLAAQAERDKADEAVDQAMKQYDQAVERSSHVTAAGLGPAGDISAIPTFSLSSDGEG